jgi:hypothetical protein
MAYVPQKSLQQLQDDGNREAQEDHKKNMAEHRRINETSGKKDEKVAGPKTKLNKLNDTVTGFSKSAGSGYNREVSAGRAGDMSTSQKSGYVAGGIARSLTDTAGAVGRGAMATGRTVTGAGRNAKNAFNNWRSKGQSSKQSPTNNANKGASQSGNPGQMANQIGGGGGSSPNQIAGETQKRTMSIMMAIPEAAIMLPIAIMLDAFGLIIFILDFMGIGIGLSFIPDILGTFSIGFWILIRSFFRGITQKIISAIENKISGIGGSNGGENQVPAGPQGGKVAKKGIKAGSSIVVWLVMTIIELIPFVGDLSPGWTISVIYELINGEVK